MAGTDHKFEDLTGDALLSHLVSQHGWTEWDIVEGRGTLDGYPKSWHEGAHNVRLVTA